MKRILYLFLALCFCTVAHAEPGTYSYGGVEYTYDDADDSCEAVAKGTPEASGALTLLSSFTVAGRTYRVTSVASNAFSGNTQITSVDIPSSILSIEQFAFRGCTSLERVYAPSLTQWLAISFGNAAANPLTFAHDLYLGGQKAETLIVRHGTTAIGAYAFYGSSIQEVTLPSSLLSIGTDAFGDCTQLAKVNITDADAWSQTDFGSERANPLFWAHSLYIGGKHLTDLELGEGITTVKPYAFYNSDIKNIKLPSTMFSIPADAFGHCYFLESIDVPDIQQWCRMEGQMPGTINSNEALGTRLKIGGVDADEIVIPEYITEIRDYCFDYENVKSVDLHPGVTAIGYLAFVHNCTLNIHSIEAWCSVKIAGFPIDGINLTHNGEEIIDLVIPEGITRINPYCFYGLRNAKSIDIPLSLTSIGASAFLGGKLERVNIHSLEAWLAVEMGNLMYKYDYDSRSCPMNMGTDVALMLNGEEIIDLVIPEGTTRIGATCFWNCKRLRSVDIPATLTSVGNGAFGSIRPNYNPDGDYDWENYMALVVNIHSLRDWCEIDFGGDAGANPLACLYPVSTPLVGTKLTVNGVPVTRRLEIPDGVTHINPYVFPWFAHDEYFELILPASITEIDSPFGFFYNYVINGQMHYCSNGPAYIECRGTTPPAIHFDDIKPYWPLSTEEYGYKMTNVSVPDEALDAYLADPNWSRFNICAQSSVPALRYDGSADGEASYFTLDGRQLRQAPESGIYIIRDARGTRKATAR